MRDDRDFFRRISREMNRSGAPDDVVGEPMIIELINIGDEHDVRIDYPNGLARIICHSAGCEEASIEIEPNTPAPIWHFKAREFIRDHPCLEVLDPDRNPYIATP